MAAFGMLLGRSITKSSHSLLRTCGKTCTMKSVLSRPVLQPCGALTTVFSRDASFFNKLNETQIWDGITGVSNPGKKKGRASKGRKKFILSKRLGDSGKFQVTYPGLNAPAGEIVAKKREELPLDQKPEYTAIKKLKKKIEPLERGYCGHKITGSRIGPPLPRGEYTFEGFDSVCVELRMVSIMSGTLGRKRSFKTVVVTGNRNGLAGYGTATGKTMKQSVIKAREQAGQRLQHIDLFRNHTVFHNFSATEGALRLMVNKQHEGYGLKCHRIIKSICELYGLKDLHVKIEGRVNDLNIVKAFFKGLSNQETHQELADRMKMHVVEFRKDKNYYPEVIASPEGGAITVSNIEKEYLDFDNLYFGGKTQYFTKRPPFFYAKTKSWQKKYYSMNKKRNQKSAQMERRVFGFEPSTQERQTRECK